MTFEAVIQQIVTANTSLQRNEARCLLQKWVSLHADDQFAPDLFFLLDCMEEDAKKATASWEALQTKMKTLGAPSLTVDEAARIGLSASSLEDIRHARQVLHEWEQAHPDERIMHEVYEVLYIKEDGWLTEIAEQNALAA